MDSAVSIKTGQFRFNFTHIIVLIALMAAIFLITNLLTVKHVVESKPDFDYEAIIGLAEEIHNTGTITDAVKSLPLEEVLIKKMCKEIEHQLAKTVDYPNCEVYFLHARQNTHYPILNYGNVVVGYEYLNIGDVWKVGMTSNGEKGRYASETFYKNNSESINLTRQNLQYKYIFQGTYKQCIVLEKILIYSYSLWSGHPSLLKPPGCKIYR